MNPLEKQQIPASTTTCGDPESTAAAAPTAVKQPQQKMKGSRRDLWVVRQRRHRTTIAKSYILADKSLDFVG
jgi:hypothetical protein